MIITLLSFKGGSGKTTIAASLAAELASRNKTPPLLLDTDPQRSFSAWAEAANKNGRALPCVATDGDNLLPILRGSPHDTIIIDTGGFGNQDALIAAYLADLIVIPIKPSFFDFDAAARTISEVNKINVKRQEGDRPPAHIRLTLSMVNPATAITKQARKDLENGEIPITGTEIANRVTYQESIMTGSAPVWYEPNGKAAYEIFRLTNEILKVAE